MYQMDQMHLMHPVIVDYIIVSRLIMLELQKITE